MNPDQIEQAFCTALVQVAPEADPQDCDSDELLREAFDLDSFDMLNLLVELKKLTGVDVPEADMGKLQTREGLLAYYQERLRA